MSADRHCHFPLVSLEHELISPKPLLRHPAYELLSSSGGEKTCMTIHVVFEGDAPLTQHPIKRRRR